jgi:hypothetical protein
MFIDSQSLIGDDVFLDLAMVEARHFFGVRFGGVGVEQRPLASVVAGNPRDRFVFLDLLRFYLHSYQDNHCIPVLSVSFHVCCFL